MKLKIGLILGVLWAVPILSMEEQLSAETIVNHPKFIIAKREMEDIGGSICIMPREKGMRLRCKYASGSSSELLYFKEPNFWSRVERFYLDCLAWLNHPQELCKTLPKSLRGQCILNIATRYQDGDQLAKDQFNELPESSKELVLKLQGYC